MVVVMATRSSVGYSCPLVPYSCPNLAPFPSLVLSVAILLLLSQCVAGSSLHVALAQTSDAVPSILSISGCALQFGAATSGCVPPVQLTLTGFNFRSASSIVNVSGTICSAPTVSNSTYLTCSMPAAESLLPLHTLLPVNVFDRISGLSSIPAPLLSLSQLPPVWLISVSGCDDFSTSMTYNCSTNTSVLTVRGSGFSSGMDAAPWLIRWTAATRLVSSVVPSLTFVNSTSCTFSLSDLVVLGGPLSNISRVTFVLLRGSFVATPPLSFTFLSTTANSAPSPSTLTAVTSGSVTVTAVTGCTPQSTNVNVAIGCYATSVVTIMGSGFPSSIAPLVVIVGNTSCSLFTLTDGLGCTLASWWNPIVSDAFLPVTVFNLFTLQQSTPYPGVQLAPLFQPVVSSISGCQGEGTLTALCNINTDVLTLTGSGFVIDRISLVLVEGVSEQLLYPKAISPTAILLPINSTWINSFLQLFLASTVYPVTLVVRHGLMISNAVAFTVAPPILQLTGIAPGPGQFACMAASSLLVVDCSPGLSQISINGVNLIGTLQVTVGSLPCNSLRVSSQVPSIICTLPAPESYIPGLAFDVLVTQTLASLVTTVIMSSAVAFTAKPTISSATSQFCPRDFSENVDSTSWTQYCASGDVLTVVGAFFSPSPLLSIVFSVTRGVTVQQSRSCGNVTVLSTNALTCFLPALSNSEFQLYGAGNYLDLSVYENATSFSNQVSVLLYRNIASAAVLSISGCGSTNAATRGVQNCQTGDVLTINGLGFFTAQPSGLRVDIWEPTEQVIYACQVPIALRGTTITCRLPYIVLVQTQVVLPIRVRTSASTSNWLQALGYSNGNTSVTGSASTDPSPSYRSAFIVCVSLLAVLIMTQVASIAFIVYTRSRTSRLLASHTGPSEEQPERWAASAKRRQPQLSWEMELH
jgi:hypothetical protein